LETRICLEVLREECERSGRARDFDLFYVGYPDAVSGAVAQEGFDYLFFVVDRDEDLGDARVSHVFYYELDDRFVSHREQGFGDGRGQGPESLALSSGHDEAVFEHYLPLLPSIHW
jgi:hypothetical protein